MRIFDRIDPRTLDRRQWELWMLALTVIFILTVGMALLMYPSALFNDLLVSSTTKLKIFIGFCALSVLLVGYLLDRQVVISQLRKRLAKELEEGEEALRESEARFRAIFENAAIGIALVDARGHPVETNAALQKILGYTKFELADMAFTEYTHPEEARADWDLFNELIKGKPDRYQMEKRFLRKDGQVVWGQLNVSLVRSQRGEFKYYIGMVEDISERKRADENMREQQNRAQTYLDIAGVMLLGLNPDQKVTLVNLKGCEILGCKREEIIGKHWCDNFVPVRERDWLNLAFAKLIAGEIELVEYVENHVLGKTGEERLIAWHNTMLRDESGKIVGTLSSGEDITERKRAEEGMRELSGRLLRLQDEERRHIARELHDTTVQGLTALGINLNVVKDSAPDLNPRARACLSESLGLAEQCSREIRTLSYLLHPPLLDEVGLGSALRWFVEGYAKRTGISVDLEIPLELARLPRDIELALFRIVQEGLTNIHLHSGSKRAHICLKWRPEQAVLTVADEGRGIPPGVLEGGGLHGAELGVGIPGMRERIRHLGGQFEILTGSTGTTLRATVPLREDQP